MSLHEGRHLPAILWVLASTAIWTVIFAAAKFTNGSVGVFQITLLRFAGALASALVIAGAAGGLAVFRSRTPGTHFLRALCGSGAALSITWASAHMPLADATALGMSYGLVLVLFGAIFLGERPGRYQLAASAVSLSGALVVMLGKGAFQHALPPWPTSLAVTSAILMAAEGVLIRILGLRERPLTVILYVCFFGLCLMLLPAWLTWQPVTGPTFFLCIGLGPLALLGQYCTIRGYSMAPLSVVGPVDYAWIGFAALLGYIAFDEQPDVTTLIGCALILGGGVVLARAGRS